jgi:hypothetical protein
MTFGCKPHGQAQRILYGGMGEGGGFPQVRAVVSFMNLCMSMARPCTKSAITMH